MPDPRDHLDLSDRFARVAPPASKPQARTPAEPPAGSSPRPWLSVWFRCCNVYARVYRNRAGTEYDGACPRCGRRIRAKIGPGGTAQRFFTAS